MQETFIVTVATAGGKCLIHEKITGNYSDLYFLLARLSNRYFSRSEDSPRLEIGPGSGICQSASDTSSCTEF